MSEKVKEKQIFGTCDKCGKIIVIGSTYWYDETKRFLPNKKFCDKQCFIDALTERKQQLIKEGKLPPEWISNVASSTWETMKIVIVAGIVCGVLFMIWLWFFMFG